VIYASLDPATTILEVAVHKKGFDVLDFRIAGKQPGADHIDTRSAEIGD
jgi:hypothetical protein